MITSLVMGDAHVEANQDLSRFKLLGPVLERYQPDNFIIMGDFLTLESLSAWDKDKRKNLEGRRYWSEINKGIEALDIIDGCIENTYLKTKRAKKKHYQPNKVFIMGNHENRLDRYFEGHPLFDDGEVSIEGNLSLEKRGYKVIPYGEAYSIGRTFFTHIPIGRNDRPISGANILRRALDLYSGSVVFGHTHQMMYLATKEIDSEQVRMAFNCGCFFTHDEDYKLNPNTYPKWTGLCLLTHSNSTEFDIETISINTLAGDKK